MTGLRTTLLVIAAAGAGFLLAWWLLGTRSPASNPATTGPVLEIPDPQPRPPADSPVVEIVVTVRDGRQPLRTSFYGVVVGQADLVIAASSEVAGAQRMHARTGSNDTATVREVAASDDIYGLVALRLDQPFGNVMVLQPDVGGGSLHSGRDVKIADQQATSYAQVDSNAMRNALGAYYYQLRHNRMPEVRPVAIVDREIRTLLGIGYLPLLDEMRAPPTQPGNRQDMWAFSAIDSEPVARLVAAAQRGRSLSLQEFATHYYEMTTPGRLLLLRHLVKVGQSEAAIEHGSAILNIDSHLQQSVPPLLSEAFAQHAGYQLERGQPERALATLEQAYDLLGPTVSLVDLEAQAWLAQGRHSEALTALLRLGDAPQLTRVREIVMGHALSEGVTDVNLLMQAISADPDFAPYHRLLGEYYASSGDAGRAVASLQRARELDRSMAAELTPLIDRLRARRETPPVSAVKIRRHAGTFLVDARINGSARTYRLVLDTGASYTAISTRVALELGLNQIFLGAPVVELQTANGRIYTTTALLDSVDVAGARVSNVEAVILENSGHWDGLLGQSFLQHFDIDIDRSQGLIHFYRRND